MRLLFFLPLWFTLQAVAQVATPLVLKPDRVFDGQQVHENWVVVIEGNLIREAGPIREVIPPNGARTIPMPGMTLMPGMIEGHAHLLLHPYNETTWNDQVLRESEAERVARGTIHARKTLEAGFTTVRDLGSEGAGYADVGLKTAIEKGVIPGPRMLVAGPAIVATGSYGPKGFAGHIEVPQGADEADGYDDLIRTVRRQIGKGADIVKVYADYRWGLMGEARPTFSEEELRLIVETAKSSGRAVVAHASTAEGMRRAVIAGVTTIEHGDGGDAAVFALMAQHQVALCPTVAAGDAILQYQGWNKTTDPDPERIRQKKESVRLALKSGVQILVGGDVGVFSHGDNAREIFLLAAYGMPAPDLLRAVTSGNARAFHLDKQLGSIRSGLLADLIAVPGNPEADLSVLNQVRWVMKGGVVYKNQLNP